MVLSSVISASSMFLVDSVKDPGPPRIRDARRVDRLTGGTTSVDARIWAPVRPSTEDVTGPHGRQSELARIDRFLDDAASGPLALFVEGPAGIGKTTLWGAGIGLAADRGWTVLTCRPVESEVRLSFSALGDLMEGVPPSAFASLPRPLRHALDVALLAADPGPEPPDQRALAVALLGVLRELVGAGPVLIGVDD